MPTSFIRRSVALPIAAAVMTIAVAYHADAQTSKAASEEHVAAIEAFEKSAPKPPKQYRIAYLTDCVDNPYCIARLNGIKDATAKFGMSYKIFDAQFNLSNQTKMAENAVSEGGFDGYFFVPIAGAPACALWKRTMQATGKPVVTVTIPMCGDADYTPGLAAHFNSSGHYEDLLDSAFASCKTPCKVAVIGGYPGSDLETAWQRAIKASLKKYPNVTLATNEPGNFDPRIALKKTQDALLAHPDISVVVSNWDDMTRGVEQAVIAAGKKPGIDVRIYSGGGTRDAIEKVKAGTIAGTLAFLPYEEGYHGTVALLMAIEGKPINGFVDDPTLPEIVDTTGTPMITKENADKFKPVY
jgi:ABC-type sugar transport system substrate-binding protein